MLWLALLLASDYADLFNRGLAAYQAKRDAEAEPLLAEAAGLKPGEFQSQFLLGAARSRLGRTDDALAAWRKAEALQPKNARLLQVMAVEYSRGRYFQEAARTAERALGLNTEDRNLYFLAIKSYQDAGDTAAAGTLAQQAVTRFPQSGRAHFEHGFHLQKQGRLDDALKHLEKAMELEPRYEEPPFFYGDLLVRRSKNAEAIPYLRKALEIRPDYVPARVLLGRALMNLQQWPDAVAELETAIRMSPDHPQPHLLMSQIYFRLGDEEKARHEKETSLRLRRESPALLEAVQGRAFGR